MINTASMNFNSFLFTCFILSQYSVTSNDLQETSGKLDQLLKTKSSVIKHKLEQKQLCWQEDRTPSVCFCDKKIDNCLRANFTSLLSNANISQDIDSHYPTFDAIFPIIIQHATNVRLLLIINFCINNTPVTINSTQMYEKNIEQRNRLNLSSIPQTPKILKLVLRNNCLEQIVASFKDPFPNLVQLNMSYNQLSHISEITFNNVTSLELLDVSYNELNSIKNVVFDDQNNLISLLLHHNKISHIDAAAFKNLNNLEILMLNHNQLETVSEMLFDSLTYLVNLSLSDNKIKFISDGTFKNLKKLVMLEMSNNQLKSIRKEWLKGLENVEVLKLNNNLFTEIEENDLMNLETLEFLNLSNNNFVEIPVINFRRNGLKPSFDFSNNNITTLHVPLSSRIRRIDILDVSNNCIQNVHTVSYDELDGGRYYHRAVSEFKCSNCCLTEINRALTRGINDALTLPYNNISHISLRQLSKLYCPIIIDISHNLITEIDVQPDSSMLEYSQLHVCTEVVIDDNPIKCDCELLPFLKFYKSSTKGLLPNTSIIVSQYFSFDTLHCSSPSRLYNRNVKSLRYNQLMCNLTDDYCPTNCTCLHAPHKDVISVNCSKRNFKHFPQLPSQIFQHAYVELYFHANKISSLPELPISYWTNISKLHLGRNRLKSLQNLHVGNKLRSLFIDSNQMTHVDNILASILTKTNSTLQIKASNNPWICNCNLMQIKQSKNIIDKATLTCASGDKLILLNETLDSELCHTSLQESNVTVAIAISSAILFIIIMAGLIIYRHFGSKIKLHILTCSACSKHISDEDDHKTYDAFVSYSCKDEDWVIQVLVHGLENGSPSYKLCLHERDWLAGDWIPNQIARSVQQSRRTIIVLTQNFVDSYWSTMEFQAAYGQMLRDSINRIIIVVPNEIPHSDQLDHKLKAFLSVNTYLRWDQPNFWAKIRRAMPTVKMQINHDKQTTQI